VLLHSAPCHSKAKVVLWLTYLFKVPEMAANHTYLKAATEIKDEKAIFQKLKSEKNILKICDDLA
jgi:hypothetical protein